MTTTWQTTAVINDQSHMSSIISYTQFQSKLDVLTSSRFMNKSNIGHKCKMNAGCFCDTFPCKC